MLSTLPCLISWIEANAVIIILGLMSWAGDIVAVNISRPDVMVRSHFGCLHF